MATSGTVGETNITAIELIDHSIIRCGVNPAKITPLHLEIARRNLFLYITYLANKGVNLWTIEKTIIGLNAFQASYSLPSGTIDTLNVLYRQITTLDPTSAMSSAGGMVAAAFDRTATTWLQQATSNGYVSCQTGGAVVTTVGYLPYGSGTMNLVWEFTIDNVSWSTLYAPGPMMMTDAQWFWHDLETPKVAFAVRVRETGGVVLAVREVVFAFNLSEIPVERYNRDDYAGLPNKTAAQRLPNQFWFNRSIDNPSIVLWPVPNDFMVALSVWRHRQIQDIGDLTNNIEFPQRWYEAVLANLAARNSLDIDGVDPQRIQLLGQLASSMEEPAYNEERDKSPSYFTPNIGVYTRGC